MTLQKMENNSVLPGKSPAKRCFIYKFNYF